MTVLARSGAAAAEIARVCRIRAAVNSSGANSSAVTFAGEAAAFLIDPGVRPEAELARLRPDAVLCLASAQSPYERVDEPSQWTDLVARAGFGLTLPLQAAVVVPVARALAEMTPETVLINGCFPDAVNPLLAALGLPVFCGIGNVAVLAACLQSTLGLPDQRALRVLGHHVHLNIPAENVDDARAWQDGSPLTGVTALLAADRALPRRELNAIAGHAAAAFVMALLANEELHTSLPGPLGLPGGYPVRLSDGTLTLALPPELSPAEAIEWNHRVGLRDGVAVRDGQVRYSPAAVAALEPFAPDLAAGWPAGALDAVTDRLTALRQRLRLAQPAGSDLPPHQRSIHAGHSDSDRPRDAESHR